MESIFTSASIYAYQRKKFFFRTHGVTSKSNLSQWRVSFFEEFFRFACWDFNYFDYWYCNSIAFSQNRSELRNTAFISLTTVTSNVPLIGIGSQAIWNYRNWTM